MQGCHKNYGFQLGTDMKRIIYLAAGAGGGAIVLLGLIAITILKFGRKAVQK